MRSHFSPQKEIPEVILIGIAWNGNKVSALFGLLVKVSLSTFEIHCVS